MTSIIRKWFEKYNKSSIQVKAALWYMVCSVVQKAVAFCTTPIFTRIMSTDDFGLYTVYNSWYWIVAVFATLNLYCGAFNNGMFDYKNERDFYTSTIQGLSTTISTILFVIYLFAYEKVYQATGLTLMMGILMYLEVLTSPALSFWLARQRFEYRYKAMTFVTLGIAVFRPVFSAVIVLLSANKGIARIVSYVGVQFAVGLVFYIYNFYKGKKFFNKTIWRNALAFNIPLIPHYLSQTLLNQADKLMIDAYCGRSEAGIYQLAMSLAMVTSIVNTSISHSLLPWIYEKLKQRDVGNIGKTCTMLMFPVAIVNLILILFAKEAIWIMGGSQYMDAVYVLPPITWSVFFMFVYGLFSNIEFYYKKTQYTMWASFWGCTLNLILNYLFIPKFGYYAAGYTTLFSYITITAIHYYFVRKIEKEEDLNKIFRYKEIIAIAILGTAFSIVIQFTYRNSILRYVIVILVTLVCLIKWKKIVGVIKLLKKR